MGTAGYPVLVNDIILIFKTGSSIQGDIGFRKMPVITKRHWGLTAMWSGEYDYR